MRHCSVQQHNLYFVCLIQAVLKHCSVSVEFERETEVKDIEVTTVTFSLVFMQLSTVLFFLHAVVLLTVMHQKEKS